jgi:hypothetical protein
MIAAIMKIVFLRGARVGGVSPSPWDEMTKTRMPTTYVASDGSTWGYWCAPSPLPLTSWGCYARRKDLKGIFDPASELTAPTEKDLLMLIEKQITSKLNTPDPSAGGWMSGATPWFIAAALAIGAFVFGRSSK